MTRIFISYSRDDLAIATQLAMLLRVSFDDVWYDQNLTGGINWWDEIERQVKDCNHFIFLISGEAIGSTYCLNELEMARKLNKHIIPIRVRRATEIPASLSWLEKLQIKEMLGEVNAISINSIYAAIIRHQQMKAESYTLKHYTADLKLCSELWHYVSTGMLMNLDEQVQNHYINADFFDLKVSEYLRLRSLPEKQFIDTQLERAFCEFDDAFNRYLAGLKSTYSYYMLGGKAVLVSQYKVASMETNDTEIIEETLQKHGEVVQRITDVVQRHNTLVKMIKIVLPDFEFSIEVT